MKARLESHCVMNKMEEIVSIELTGSKKEIHPFVKDWTERGFDDIRSEAERASSLQCTLGGRQALSHEKGWVIGEVKRVGNGPYIQNWTYDTNGIICTIISDVKRAFLFKTETEAKSILTQAQANKSLSSTSGIIEILPTRDVFGKPVPPLPKETVWLIMSNKKHGRFAFVDPSGSLYFCQAPAEAMQFAREQDAISMIKSSMYTLESCTPQPWVPAHNPEPKIAWLIERKDPVNEGCVTGEYLTTTLHTFCATENIEEAIRFERESDAEQVCRTLPNTDYTATEHQWN